MKNRSLMLTLIVTLLLVSGWMRGIDPVADEAGSETILANDVAQQQELAEINRIRQKLGGSVLKGSILDSPSTTSEFDANVRTEITKKTAANTSSLLNAHRPGEAFADPHGIVANLRKHSSRLDAIANHIESFREYESADALRESAKELRLIARQMDRPRRTGVADQAGSTGQTDTTSQRQTPSHVSKDLDAGLLDPREALNDRTAIPE